MSIHESRLARLRERMRAEATDLVALGPTSHMRWLAGLDPHGDERPVMLLVSQDHAGVLMPALNADAARGATDLPFYPWRDDEGPGAALAALLADCGAGPGAAVAVDEAMRADFALRLLDALPGARRSFAAETVGALRRRKDEAEIDALRASARANDAAVTETFDALREGMSEREAQAILFEAFEARGASPVFAQISFGPTGAFPHYTSGEGRLAPEMPVLIDAGCRLGGYPSDMTRCAWFGASPDPEYLEVAALVERAVRAALDAARPGAAAREVDAAARGTIAAGGHGPHFLHRTGHGLGIDIHEPPYITASSDVALEAGDVFSIEPGIYLAGRFGVRLEDIVVLREGGPEILSGLPRDVRVLRAGGTRVPGAAFAKVRTGS